MSDTKFDQDVDALMAVAVDAAARAAAVHRSASRSTLQVDQKSSPTDLVTDVDRDAESALVEALRRARPGDGIVGEEGTNQPSETGVSWILDPLDGTTNFVYGYPAHAVSIGVEIAGRRVLGVVSDMARGCVYTGIVSRGARRDETPLSVGAETRSSLALLGTGFLPDAQLRATQGHLLGQLAPRFRDLRRSGSAAIDLCLLASGALDVYYEFGLGHWDISGGAAIAEAAGATVLELEPRGLPAPLLVAGNASLVEELVSMLDEAGFVRA